MKLLTLNTHSLVEEHYPQKLHNFVEAAAWESPDIIALQEVSQTADAQELPLYLQRGYVPAVSSAVIRRDNHVYNAVRMLADRGIQYSWTWLPLKLGYGRYDEGIALMSRSPILETDVHLVSSVNDYHNWKTRKILGIRTASAPQEWFCSVHFGWWNDTEEPFAAQWERTQAHLRSREMVWLMGDFNNPAEVRHEGYDLISRSGWHDSFLLSAQKSGEFTVGGVIDGWRDRLTHHRGMRIDQIWCSKKAAVRSSEVLFDGIRYPVVSDHYGIMIDYERRGI